MFVHFLHFNLRGFLTTGLADPGGTLLVRAFLGFPLEFLPVGAMFRICRN